MQELFSFKEYQKHLEIALKAHKKQTTPHNLPYSFHFVGVANQIILSIPFEKISYKEANISIAIALLHDVLEDTNYPLEKEPIDNLILEGVKALTKNKDKFLTKELLMRDSIKRLQQLPKYIQMVKIADRINNLSTPPPYWSFEKTFYYYEEATLIYRELKSPKEYLNKKFLEKIETYKEKYICV